MKTKKVRPVLIGTDDVVSLGSIMQYIRKAPLHDDEVDLGNLAINVNRNVVSSNEYWQHKKLILISLEDEGIEVGGQMLDFEFGYLTTNTGETNRYLTRYCKKVIAIQDQISPEYIAKFIEQYNSDNVEDVEIEMEECDRVEEWNEIDGTYETFKIRPKLTNGFVTIVEKESILYTEEEVLTYCLKALELIENECKNFIK